MIKLTESKEHKMNVWQGKMERDAAKIKNHLNIDPDVIFDVGANIGVYSISFSQLFPNATIYSFEPVKKTYDVLVRNIELNNTSNIIPLNYGVYNENMVAEMGIPEDRSSRNFGLYTMKFGGKTKDDVMCSFRNIKNILEEFSIDKIDLMKMDCEGCEYDILSSGSSLLDITKNIHIELNEGLSDTEMIKDLLTNNNFEFMKRTRKANQLWVKK